MESHARTTPPAQTPDADIATGPHPYRKSELKELYSLLCQPARMVQVMTRCTALRPTMAHMFVHRFGSAGDMVLGPHFQVDYRFPHQAPPAGLDLTTVNVACAGYGIRAYLRPFVHLARQGAIYISEYDDTGQSKNLAGRRYLISEMLEPFRDRLLPGPPLNN